MFVYQNGKLYVQLEEGLVGVEIHSNEVLLLKTEKGKLDEQFEFLSSDEINARFQGEYKFPKKEVIVDDTVGKTKDSVRKPRGK